MKQTILIFLAFFMFYSCKNNTTNKESKQTKYNISEEGPIIKKTNKNHETNENKLKVNIDLHQALSKAVKSFPNDSVSLYRFYFEWFPAKDKEKSNKHIKRLENLTSQESIEKYRTTEEHLRPLMLKIVDSNEISKSQSASLVELYSNFDYFSGESLFTQYLQDDENYKLVWESFKIMIKESGKDTCFISDLIELNKNIRTNAELAQEMEGFIVKAIRNNPTGFLEMYSYRKAEKRSDFANHIAVLDAPDKELIEKFTEISKNSTDEKNRQLATELIGRFEY